MNLAEVISGALSERLNNVHVALPAKVVSYDAAQNKISAQPLINQHYVDSDGNDQSTPLPIVNEIPVIFPGSDGARIRFPITVGDTVLLIFCSASIDRWLVRGDQVDPEFDRRHDLNDAVAIPGLGSFADKADKTPQIDITESQIKAGGSSALTLDAKFREFLSDLADACSAAPLTPIKTLIDGWLLANTTGTQILKGS